MAQHQTGHPHSMLDPLPADPRTRKKVEIETFDFGLSSPGLRPRPFRLPVWAFTL